MDVGAAVPARVEACTQTELQMVDAAPQVPGCRSCAVLEELCLQVEELWEEVSRLCSIREAERETDRIFSATQQLEKPQHPSAVEKQVVSTPTTKGSETSREGEGSKLVTSDTKRKDLAPPKGLQLQNRFIALKVEEEPDVPTSKVSGPPNP